MLPEKGMLSMETELPLSEASLGLMSYQLQLSAVRKQLGAFQP